MNIEDCLKAFVALMDKHCDYPDTAMTQLAVIAAKSRVALAAQSKPLATDYEVTQQLEQGAPKLNLNPVGYLFKGGHPGLWEFSIYPDAKTDVKPTPVYEAPYIISSAPQSKPVTDELGAPKNYKKLSEWLEHENSVLKAKVRDLENYKPVDERELPPLPKAKVTTDMHINGRGHDAYTQDQMREYARAALNPAVPKDVITAISVAMDCLSEHGDGFVGLGALTVLQDWVAAAKVE